MKREERTGLEATQGVVVDRRRFVSGILATGAATYATPAIAEATGEGQISPLPLDEIFALVPAGENYCVYQVTKVTPEAGQACPFALLQSVCVDCPPGGNCLGHASVGIRRWRLWNNANRDTLICSGEWTYLGTLVMANGQIVGADCEACPEGGFSGYRFI